MKNNSKLYFKKSRVKSNVVQRILHNILRNIIISGIQPVTNTKCLHCYISCLETGSQL